MMEKEGDRNGERWRVDRRVQREELQEIQTDARWDGYE